MLGLRSQGGGQFGESPGYDVQVAVHCPQLYQDVADIRFQAHGGSRRGASARLWGGTQLPSALIPACHPWARCAAVIRVLAPQLPLSSLDTWWGG